MLLMQSEKVFIMPILNPERPSQLRREENPPYPEYDIEILREVLNIRDSVGETTCAVKTLESELKNHGEKLGSVAEMAQAIKNLETASRKQGLALEEVGKDAHSAKIAIRILVGIMIVAAGAIAWAITTYIGIHPFK